MNLSGFTNEARGALMGARSEAIGFGHEYIGTEHLLLALIANPDNIATATLGACSITSAAVRDAMDRQAPRGPATSRPDLPFDSRAKHALEHAMAFATETKAPAVHTGHMLLGVLREGKGFGYVLLSGLGLTLDAAQTAMADAAAKTNEGAWLTSTAPPAPRNAELAMELLHELVAMPGVADVFRKHNVDVDAIAQDLMKLR